MARQMVEEAMHCRGPRARVAPHRVTDTDHALIHVPPDQGLFELSHRVIMPAGLILEAIRNR